MAFLTWVIAGLFWWLTGVLVGWFVIVAVLAIRRVRRKDPR